LKNTQKTIRSKYFPAAIFGDLNVGNPTLHSDNLSDQHSMQLWAETPYVFWPWFYACLSWQLPPIFTCTITWPKNRHSSDVQLVTFRQSCKGSFDFAIRTSDRRARGIVQFLGPRASVGTTW